MIRLATVALLAVTQICRNSERTEMKNKTGWPKLRSRLKFPSVGFFFIRTNYFVSFYSEKNFEFYLFYPMLFLKPKNSKMFNRCS